ncbi:MAG: ABC transporter ATP-binding protein [Chloroflexota bacterium]|nr:MAG: ABC transporter ATP-binding protein [Chloroflexota bacterium]
MASSPTRVNETALLEVDDLTVRFGGLCAVNGLSFRVKTGEIKGLIGPNGSGKSTVFNSISGVYRPQAGKILFDGKNILKLPPHDRAKKGILRTFQNIRLFSHMTVLDNVLVGLHTRMTGGVLESCFRLRRTAKEEEVREESLRLLDLVHLREYADRPASTLSFGQQRWLELTRALAAKPKLFLLDEIASGMSHSEAEETKELLRSINREQDVTLLVIEHNMGWVFGLCDSVVCMNFGSKLIDGTPEEVKNDRRVIEAYLGEADHAANP